MQVEKRKDKEEMEGIHDNVSAFISKGKEKFRKRFELD